MNEKAAIFPASGLEQILGSQARLRVARLLIDLPEKEFTGREVARLLGMSHSTVLGALRVVTDRGLATERVLGRAHVFRVNREHFLHDVLATLFRSERGLRGRITETIRASLEASSVSLILFGSRARGSAGGQSDVDLIVVTRDVDESEAAVSRLSGEFRRTYGLELDAKVLTPRQLKSRLGTPFVKAALTEGIRIGGIPLAKVMGPAD